MLSQFCIQRPIFATVLAILIVLAGVLAWRQLPLSQYPDISPPSMRISAQYEGADVQTIARTVAQPIEDQLSGIDGLLYYTTTIRSNGVISISCVFDVDTNPNDAMMEINNRVRSAERSLPEVVRERGVTVRKRSEESLLRVALWSPDGSLGPTDLADYANLNIVNEMKRLPGVGDVSVFGNTESAMRIWVDPDKMGKLGVTVDDIRSAVKTQNAQHTAGRIGNPPTPNEQQLFYTAKAPGQLLAPEDFANIVLKKESDGSLIRLRDVARTELGKRSYEFRVDLNGAPAVNMGVYLKTGANAMEAAVLAKERLTELAQFFPKDQINYFISDDSSVFVSASLKEVFSTLLEAGTLVLLVIFLFLQNWRATLIPLLAIPVSLIGTMAGLWALGLSLNTLTLFAMTLAIGIVVDDAIVVIENIDRLISEEKMTPFAAAQKAMTEVSGALVAIVLVLCAVFIPVAFLGGIAGELYRQFAVTIAVSVALSGFIALTLTPALCALLLKPHDETRYSKHGVFGWFNRFLSALTDSFVKTVAWLLRYRVVSAISLILVTGGAYYLFSTLPTVFLPKEDQGRVGMAIQLPEGTAFQRTDLVGTELLKELRKVDGVESIVAMFGFDSSSSDVKSNMMSLSIKLKPWSERTETAADMQLSLQDILRQSSEATGTASLPSPIPGLGSTNGFSGYVIAHGSDNLPLLQEIINNFMQALSQRPELTGLRSIMRADTPQLLLTVDRDKASSLGVSLDDVYDTVSYLTAGNYINDFTRNGKTYRVMLQAEGEFRQKPENLGSGWVRASNGTMVPVASLVTVQRTSGTDSLRRFNGYLAGQFLGNAVKGTSSGEAIQIVEQVAAQVLPPGYTIEWVDQAYHEKRIGSSTSAAFGYGLLMVMLILAALYERWSLPIAVLLAIPYALLGALSSLWLRSMSNDIYFQIGLLVLIGLTAKNAILIVEFAQQLMEEKNLTPVDAALEAAKLRLRPILMTSAAFILGVLPMVLATGPGASARQSMGTGVFGGMIISTFVATIFIPVFFTWFARHRKKRN